MATLPDIEFEEQLDLHNPGHIQEDNWHTAWGRLLNKKYIKCQIVGVRAMILDKNNEYP